MHTGRAVEGLGAVLATILGCPPPRLEAWAGAQGGLRGKGDSSCCQQVSPGLSLGLLEKPNEVQL